MPIMYVRLPRSLRRRAALPTARNACFAVAGWAAAAVVGFLADRGPGRGLDTGSQVQLAAAAATIVLTAAGFALWLFMIRREAVVRRFWAEVEPVVAAHTDEASTPVPAPVATAPAARTLPASRAG